MKKFRLISAAMVLCAAMLLSVSAQAQSVVFLAAGSSAMFNDTAYTATVLNSQGYVLCGPNVWTLKNGAQIVDSRNASILPETGNVWVSWNGSANGSGATKICAYISVDSAVGVRAAMAVPAATISLPSSDNGAAGGNIVPNLPQADSPLPASIYAALNGQSIQVAASDVRPEDAKFATVRALSPLGQGLVDPNPTWNNPMGSILLQAQGLGYAQGTGTSAAANIGNSIKSSQSSTVANPVNFSLFGQDPFGSNPSVNGWVTIKVGAAPVIVFVNKTNTASGHFGDGNCTNITTSTLCGVLDGTLQRNIDICEPTTVTNVFGVPVYEREPISGTYNTTESATVGSFQCFSTQERNVNPSTNNPMEIAGTIAGNGRYRVIGTGEMVKTVAANADAIGYAFWGYGNFSASNNSAPTNTRYLLVDSVDPLYANSGTGANPNGAGSGVFPTPVSGSYPVLTFPNINNGTYRIWTTYRFLVPNVATPAGQNNYAWANLFATIAQSDASTIYSDFIPASSLNVIHDHFYQSWSGAYNDCTNNEAGGDMGGSVFTCEQVTGYPAANGGATLIQKHM
jgi:hypothetical protein